MTQNNSVIPDDPFGPIKKPAQRVTPPPEEVNRFHERADTDSSATAIHHSLGVKNTQAAPGDHKHDGVGSRKLMEGIVVTGSKGGNAALASLISQLSSALGFTDATS
jgi:hypothetical protein